MSMLDTAAQLFLSKLGGDAAGVDQSSVAEGLKDLLPTSGSDLDLSQLVGQFTQAGGGIAGIAMSWLGNGGNLNISAEQIQSVMGGSNIAAFAQRLGLDSGAALSGLTQMVPELIDKVSADGVLSNDRVLELGKGLLGKLF